MEWKEFSVGKLITGIIVLIIGLILKFPQVLESFPPKYKILGLITVTESQYAVINIISYVLILLSIIYIIVLLVSKFKK